MRYIMRGNHKEKTNEQLNVKIMKFIIKMSPKKALITHFSITILLLNRPLYNYVLYCYSTKKTYHKYNLAQKTASKRNLNNYNRLIIIIKYNILH